MGFKRPLVRIQSLGPMQNGKSPETAKVSGFFLFFSVKEKSRQISRNHVGLHSRLHSIFYPRSRL
nr:MAG TPA: hypothetical protein [Caudoviricetes sp.]